MLKRFVNSVTAQKNTRESENYYRELIKSEARIGGAIFGDIKHGQRREFFCLDPHTWIWHEEWSDEKGSRQIMTTRYDVRPDGILKSQSNSGYKAVSPQEARHLIAAAKEYRNRAFGQLYKVAV